MSWWDSALFVFNAVVFIGFFSYILSPFLPERYNYFAEIVGLRILSLIVGIPLFLKNIWVISSAIAYFLGMFSILALLIIGMVLFGYTLAFQLGYENYAIQPLYDQLVLLSKNKAAWAGATMIIATTIAIGHMWNLRLNSAKFKKEMAKLHREEGERIEKRVASEKARIHKNT